MDTRQQLRAADDLDYSPGGSKRELRITYLLIAASSSRENEGGNDANDDDDDDKYKNWLSRCANANLRTRASLEVKSGQRVLSTAIYIGVAMPRGPVRREIVSFLEKQITGVDQRRGDDLLFGLGLTKERHKNRSVSASDAKHTFRRSNKSTNTSTSSRMYLNVDTVALSIIS